jgi:hypothetical protein
MKNIIRYVGSALAMAMLASSCQKMEQPALGDYAIDTNPPGGPLNFYAAFDGTSNDPLRNAVDSIRANFPVDNPLTSIDGISGAGLRGENKKYVKYSKPNDWANAAKAFTISCWYRKDGQTKNNIGGNGPEYLVSFKSNNGHWSGSNLLFFLEGNNTACAVKVMIADANVADSWMTWENATAIPGLVDNQWHHVAIVYDNNTSTMTLYIDGVANPGTRTWGGHGDINISPDAISEMRIGSGPADNVDTDNWLASTFKGDLDQFRMYSEALSAAEIQELYTARK